jgi:hypothetical protein
VNPLRKYFPKSSELTVIFPISGRRDAMLFHTGEIPYSADLFRLCQENGWLNIRRGLSTIREGRAQRRVMAA